jgi:hypothetical protein
MLASPCELAETITRTRRFYPPAGWSRSEQKDWSGFCGSIFDDERILSLKPSQRVQHFIPSLLAIQDFVNVDQIAEGEFMLFNSRFGLCGNHQRAQEDRLGFGEMMPSRQYGTETEEWPDKIVMHPVSNGFLDPYRMAKNFLRLGQTATSAESYPKVGQRANDRGAVR